jgi:hypothetical protein
MKQAKSGVINEFCCCFVTFLIFTPCFCCKYQQVTNIVSHFVLGNKSTIARVLENTYLCKKLMRKQQQFIGIITGAIVSALAFWAVQQLFFKPASFDETIVNTANEINKMCPFMIDGDTRLDNVAPLPNNTIQYNYTLVDIEQAEVNSDTVRKYFEPTLIATVKSLPDLKIFRDHNTTFIYNYRDKNGIFVLKIPVTPEMYQ